MFPTKASSLFDALPPRQYVGAAAYRKDWEDFLGTFPGPLAIDISDLDVTVGGGDVAYGHNIQHGVGDMKGGKKMDFTVRVTDGYKKVNGQWELQEMEIRNVQTGSRTRLEFDLNK